MRGRYRPVVDCRSRTDASGNEKWVYKLDCGASGEKVRKARNSRKDKAAPIRVLCKCPRCV